jgi:hypothetical protein
LLPAQTRVLAVFSAPSARRALATLTNVFPKIMRAESSDGLQVRIRELYGVDLSSLGSYCCLAFVEELGPVLICEGGTEAKPPEGSSRWADHDDGGYTVPRGPDGISISIRKGMLFAGAPKAVARLLQVGRGEWPSLKAASGRWRPAVDALSTADGYREFAIYFLDRAAAPWCGPDCTSTAVFASQKKGGAIVALAKPGAVEPVRLALTGFLAEAVRPFEALAATEAELRPVAISDAAIKRGDLPARPGRTEIRGEQVVYRVTGEVLVLAAILRYDLMEQVFGIVRARP